MLCAARETARRKETADPTVASSTSRPQADGIILVMMLLLAGVCPLACMLVRIRTCFGCGWLLLLSFHASRCCRFCASPPSAHPPPAHTTSSASPSAHALYCSTRTQHEGSHSRSVHTRQQAAADRGTVEQACMHTRADTGSAYEQPSAQWHSRGTSTRGQPRDLSASLSEIADVVCTSAHCITFLPGSYESIQSAAMAPASVL